MNANRRKQIEALATRLEEIRDDVTILMDEEQEARDNLPDNLQDSERAGQMDEAVDQLQEAQDLVDQAREALDAAAEQ